MRFTSIRSRMLVAALVPVAVVVLTLMGVFWVSRVDDITSAHTQRSQLLLKQVLMASEFGLFSGNQETLQSVAEAVHGTTDVRSVAVFNASGGLMASSGAIDHPRFDQVTTSVYAVQQRAQGVDVFFAPILSSQIDLQDPLFQSEAGPSRAKSVLGYALIEMSRASLIERERDLFYIAVWIGLVGLLVGGVLAARLGERVVSPILRVSYMIERIGKGDLTTRLDASVGDPLFDLQVGLNHMVKRLAWGREELEQRVQEVTHELNLKKEEAESATLAKSRFLATASHDLRQPTHALGLFIARLGQLPLDDQTRTLVGQLEASTQAMQDLLDGLLDISRLESGVVPVKVTSVSVQQLFDRIEFALAPQAAAKGLRLRLRSGALWVKSDVALLQRMVLNLAYNALRYSDKGTILITCRGAPHGTQARLQVWDSGIGIAPEHQANIFKEFFQVDNPNRVRTSGMGLGLNIVQRSAQLLGINVAVRSALGCGTRFTLTLPLVDAPETPRAASPVTATATELHGVRVMVVEDDQIISQALSELLQSWGCVVQLACSAAQAIEIARIEPMPTILLSDYRLGEAQNGLYAIAALRELAGYKIAACLMSGDTDAGLMQAAKDADLILLHKPVRPAKLRTLLRRFVAAQEQGSAENR